MQKIKIWKASSFKSKGYFLTPFELKDSIPFEVKRIYTIYAFEDQAKSGEHCHKIEQEVFVQISGSSSIIIDEGEGKKEIPMHESDAIYVPNMVWHGFKNLSKDSVILAFSSTNYGEHREDYIEDYNLYLQKK